MSKRVLILVEGQTEEKFVKDILAPTFWPRHIYFSPTILITKRVKNGPNFTGGVTNFNKFSNDLKRLLFDTDAALVTTLLDYYRLPADFPGMDTRLTFSNASDRVTHVEQAIAAYFGSLPKFLPFLALHEFEAWLFSSPTELPKVMTDTAKRDEFAAICRSFTSPEDINDNPQSAPSKRVMELFPAYRKVIHGSMTISRIGLEQIRSQCPHFDRWIRELERLSGIDK